MSEKIGKMKHYLQGTIHMNSESIDQIHESYMDSVNGRYSENPMVEMVIPSLLDPTLTPEGSNHVVAQLFVMYSPNTLKDGQWDEDTKQRFKDLTYKVIDSYAPGFSDSIVHEDVLFPNDLEEIFGITGGNIFHGAVDLHNLFINRPQPNYSNYEGPFTGMWRCGSSTHPGGGVMGAPGRNCALKMVADKKFKAGA